MIFFVFSGMIVYYIVGKYLKYPQFVFSNEMDIGRRGFYEAA